MRDVFFSVEKRQNTSNSGRGEDLPSLIHPHTPKRELNENPTLGELSAITNSIGNIHRKSAFSGDVNGSGGNARCDLASQVRFILAPRFESKSNTFSEANERKKALLVCVRPAVRNIGFDSAAPDRAIIALRFGSINN